VSCGRRGDVSLIVGGNWFAAVGSVVREAMDGNNDVYPLPVGPNDLCFEKSEFIKVLRVE
jgi:hypothetical protein